MAETKKTKKKIKKKGPIRFEAVIPFTIVCSLVALYSFLFLDSNIKSIIELGGSYGYGAEVNVDKVETSFSKGSLDIDNIQITNIDKPSENVLQIGSIRMSFSWDALLRAKFVITESSINDIRINSKRNRDGKIYRTKEETKEAAESAAKSAKTQIAQNTQKELEGNVFGDAASLLDGKDPTEKLGEIQSELATQKKIDEIQAQVDEKEKHWQQRLKNLPNKEKLNSHVAEIKKLKFDFKNPKEFGKSLKKGKQILRAADSDIKLVKSDTTAFQTDLKLLKQSVKELEKTKQEDLKNLQSRVSIPELDTKKLALMLFGDSIREYVDDFEKYSAMAQEYMPQDSGAEKESDESLQARKRAEGKTYEFPKAKSYPLFWLQRAAINSKADNSSLSGNLSGEITDVTSNPAHLGKPAILNLQGEFPSQGIYGINAKVVFDYRTEQPIETLNATVASFPVAGRDFSKSEKVEFGFSKANGSSKISAVKKGDQLNMTVFNRLKNVDYKVKAKSKALAEALTQVTRDVPVITISARANGHWRSPGLSLRTNLATAIKDSLNRQIKAKISAAKAKIRGLLDSKVSAQQNKLTSSLNKFGGKYSKDLSQLSKHAGNTKSLATKELTKAQKSGKTKSLEKKAEKEVKKLFKNLSF